MFAAILATVLGSQVANLRTQANRIHLNLGTCVQPLLLNAEADGGLYVKTISENFNLVEPENDLKPPALWLARGKYAFGNADSVVEWARKALIKVRGHVLLYARDDGYTIPRWLLADEANISPAKAEELLHEYIRDVAGRYRGKIAMWDVINEAIDDSPNSNPYNLRNSFWFRKLGVNFLTLAFKFAHEADPKAELYYNEYGVENGGRKAENMLALAKFIQESGAPITGLGLQYHTVLAEHAQAGDGHYQLLTKIAEQKLAFMVTELDLGISLKPFPVTDPNYGKVAKNAEDLNTQAERYANIFTMALSFKNCHGIQLWGLTDAHSWIPGFSRGSRGAALLFDAKYQPKPAFDRVYQVLASTRK